MPKHGELRNTIRVLKISREQYSTTGNEQINEDCLPDYFGQIQRNGRRSSIAVPK